MSCALTALIKEHVTLVVGYADTMEVTWLARILVKELILILRIAQLMIVYLMIFIHIREFLTCHRFVVCGIEEAILIPAGISELGPFNMVGQQLLGSHIQHVYLNPVRTAALNCVCQILTIVRQTHSAQRHSAVI